MTVREWAGEQKPNVRRVEGKAALQETFECRPAQHDQPASDRCFAPDQVADECVVPKIEQKTQQTRQGGKPDEFGGTPQIADKAERSPFEQGPPEIQQREIHLRGTGASPVRIMQPPHGRDARATTAPPTSWPSTLILHRSRRLLRSSPRSPRRTPLLTKHPRGPLLAPESRPADRRRHAGRHG